MTQTTNFGFFFPTLHVETTQTVISEPSAVHRVTSAREWSSVMNSTESTVTPVRPVCLELSNINVRVLCFVPAGLSHTSTIRSLYDVHMTLSTTQTASHKCRIRTNYQLQYAVNVYHVHMECLQNIWLNSILHHNITNIVLLLSASVSSNQNVNIQTSRFSHSLNLKHATILLYASAI